MGKNKAIPQDFMTVGELAKKMGVTVRTLQHYDREGFFSPSSESEGGRRLYTNEDLVRLHQILSLKHLGFSLADIKTRLMSLSTPEDVAKVLAEQAEDIKRKIESLTKSLEEIELLKTEVLQMHSVDFKKYSDIIVNLQMQNKHYWLIKHFDEQTLDHLHKHFDMESGAAFMNKFTALNNEVQRLKKNNMPPENEESQLLAKAFWDMIMEFTGGDMSMVSKLMELGDINKNAVKSEQAGAVDMDFIEKALDVYLTKLGFEPLEEDKK